MADEKIKEPCGIIAIMTNSTGDVIATAADFERQAPGGFKLWEGQRQRACRQVKWATVRAYCGPVVSEAVGSYLASQIADELLRKGHKLTCRAVGYPDEVAVEVRR